MQICFLKREEVTSGNYCAEVTRASVELTKRGERLVITFEPFDQTRKYKEVTLWISGNEAYGSPAHQFFQALGIEGDKLDAENVVGELEGQKVTLQILDNEKEGKTYHNVTGVSPIDGIHKEHSEKEYEFEAEDLDEEEELDEDDEEEDDEPHFPSSPQSFGVRRRRSSRR